MLGVAKSHGNFVDILKTKNYGVKILCIYKGTILFKPNIEHVGI